MNQQLIAFNYNTDQIAAIALAIGEVETQFQGLASLSIEARRAAATLGPKSEVFCRKTINALTLNPQIVPPGVPVAEAVAGFEVLDRLRPLFDRLHRLSQRSLDTELAIGSEIMDTALQGDGVLKAVGRKHGLDGLRRELGERRFRAVRPAAEEEPAPTA